MKKMNGQRRTKRSRTNPHDRNKTGTIEKKHNRKETNNMVNAQTSMMHVHFNEAWRGKVQQTILQVKWSSICNELHIDETPHSSYLVCSRLCTQQH